MPFGPSARPAQTSLASVAGEDLIPAGADDFWGEDSAAVQDALQAPSAARRPNTADASGGSVSSARERALGNTRRLHRPSRATVVVGLVAITIATPVIVIAAGASSGPKTGAHRSIPATTNPSGDFVEAAKKTLGALVGDVGAASKLPAQMRRPAASQRSRRRTPVRAGAHHASNPPRPDNPQRTDSPPRTRNHRNLLPATTRSSSAASQTQDSGTTPTTPLVAQPVVLTPTGSSTRSQAPATSSTGGRGGGSSPGSGSNSQNDLPTPGGLPPP